MSIIEFKTPSCAFRWKLYKCAVLQGKLINLALDLCKVSRSTTSSKIIIRERIKPDPCNWLSRRQDFPTVEVTVELLLSTWMWVYSVFNEQTISYLFQPCISPPLVESHCGQRLRFLWLDWQMPTIIISSSTIKSLKSQINKPPSQATFALSAIAENHDDIVTVLW